MFSQKLITFHEKAIFKLPLASFSERALLLILSYYLKFSFTCKLNSFSYAWLSTRSHFKKEAKGNSEIASWKCAESLCASIFLN